MAAHITVFQSFEIYGTTWNITYQTAVEWSSRITPPFWNIELVAGELWFDLQNVYYTDGNSLFNSQPSWVLYNFFSPDTSIDCSIHNRHKTLTYPWLLCPMKEISSTLFFVTTFQKLRNWHCSSLKTAVHSSAETDLVSISLNNTSTHIAWSYIGV